MYTYNYIVFQSFKWLLFLFIHVISRNLHQAYFEIIKREKSHIIKK